MLTPREHDVYRAITQHQHKWGEAPTRRELGLALGIRPPSVEIHLQSMRRKGVLVLRRRWRGIGLT